MSIKNLERGIKFVNKQGIYVEYMGAAKPLGSQLPFNGCAYLDFDQIDLYADDPRRDADKVLACLVHEYGHIMDWKLYGGGDSEVDAWEVGIEEFPPDLIPDCLDEVMEACLLTYDKSRY